MIQFHTWKTPNGFKAAIMLEESGLPYEVHPVDLAKDEQFDPKFLAYSPNHKIPLIVDDGQVVFESGAILTYLADKSGRLLAPKGSARWDALSWLFWSSASLTPMLAQLNFFAVRSKEKVPVAIDRFGKESQYVLQAMESRLTKKAYLGGAEYSVADVAAYPWIAVAKSKLTEPLGDTLAQSPALNAWFDRLGERKAVQAGMNVPNDLK